MRIVNIFNLGLPLLLVNIKYFYSISRYFHFINLGETARRVRIVRELWEAQIELSMNELIQRYNASEIIDVRLQRMIQNKQIIERDGKYCIGKPVMLGMAKIIILMKQILLGKTYADNGTVYESMRE